MKLLVTAALLAAGIATSIAQNVYSLNVVGYYNVTVNGGGFTCVANQLKTANNTIDEVLPFATWPSDAIVMLWDNANTKFAYYVTDNSAWYDNDTGDPSGTVVILPGTGIYVNNSGAAFSQTFVGEVKQGDVSLNIQPGFNAIGAVTPQQLDLAANGFPQVAENLLLHIWDFGTTAFANYINDGAGQWYNNDTGDPVTLTPGVGIGYFAENLTASPIPWTRNFTVE